MKITREPTCTKSSSHPTDTKVSTSSAISPSVVLAVYRSPSTLTARNHTATTSPIESLNTILNTPCSKNPTSSTYPSQSNPCTTPFCPHATTLPSYSIRIPSTN